MLSHIKVLDLTDGLGAYTGRLLAELGADVLKIESSMQVGDAAGLVFDAGKRRLRVDLQTDAGRAAFLDLLDTADVLVRNDVKVPFDHERMSRDRPKLIDVIVGPFDPQGADANRPATDLTLMARSGLMTIVGDPDRPPLRLPGQQSYALAGIQGAIAALTAIYERNASGKGQLVTVSALQSTVLANYREPLMWQWAGRVGNRTGNLLVRGRSGVRQVWRCLNGYVTWSFVDNPGMMRALVRVMRDNDGGDELSSIGWDTTLVADVPRETLIEWERTVEQFFGRQTKETLARWSMEHGFGLSQIDEIDDVLASEQLRQRNMWRELKDPESGTSLRVPGPLFVRTERKQ